MFCMRELIKRFKDDFLLVGLSCCNLLLLASMVVSPEVHDWFFWISLAFRASFPLVALFFGSRGAWVAYFIYTNLHALNMSYDDFTAVAVICVLFSLLPKVTKGRAIAVTSLYLVDVFVVASLHDKEPYHIFVHLVGCICFSLAMWKLKVTTPHAASGPLSLLPDEEAILEQLAAGVLIKNIEGYSENTIYSNLKKARGRNGCKTNEALILAFKKERQL